MTGTTGSTWKVNCEPHSDTLNEEGKNKGGLIVYLTNGLIQKEFTRVAFDRKEGAYPKESFKERLQVELVAADNACKAINDADAAVATAREALDQLVTETAQEQAKVKDGIFAKAKRALQ